MTPFDPFLTFDLVNIIELFSWLIKSNKMQQTRSKSNHVFTFTPVKFNDPYWPFVTFDLVNMIYLFSLLINPNKMQQTPSKSEHVLTFTSVMFNDP